MIRYNTSPRQLLSRSSALADTANGGSQKPETAFSLPNLYSVQGYDTALMVIKAAKALAGSGAGCRMDG